MKYVYLIKNSEDDTYKIGVAKDPNKRLRQLQTGCPYELLLIEKYQTEHYNTIEKTFHRRYSYLKKEGEWFSLSLIEQFSFLDDCKRIENGITILRENGNVFA